MSERQKQPNPEVLSRQQAIEAAILIASYQASESPEAFLNESEATCVLAEVIDLHGATDDPYLTYKKIAYHDKDLNQSFEARVYPDANQQPSILHMWAYDHNHQVPLYGVVIPVQADNRFDSSRPIMATWGGQRLVYDPSGQRLNEGPADLVNHAIKQSAVRVVTCLQNIPIRPDLATPAEQIAA